MIKLQPTKMTHTKTDTIIVTRGLVDKWKAPPFQRPLRVNEKVKIVTEEIKESGGVIPGVLTLGIFEGDTYLIDGQHRVHAFVATELAEGFADIRTFYAQSIGEMADEFFRLNSRLVQMRPDDFLKGLEASSDELRYIRKRCPFVGYDYVRRGPNTPLISMATTLRSWSGSAPETPTSGIGSAVTIAESLTHEEAETLVHFMTIASQAWGRDQEYWRLWSALNIVLCMWLYRRTVITQYSPNTARLTKDEFTKCLMSLSADSSYVDWLVGRNLGERDRSPAYTRIKAIFTKRMEDERTGMKIRLPSPDWSHGHAGKKR